MAISVFFSGIFLNFRLNFNFPIFTIFGSALLFSLLYIILRLKEHKIIVKIDKKKIIVLFLLMIFVFAYIYYISGKLVPTEPLGSGDLNAHMKMVYHFKYHNTFKMDENRIIYPQVLHAFISIIADIFNVKPEKVITLFLSIILILTFFIVYVLMKYFFPDISTFPFFIAIFLANLTFIFRTIFIFYYFPPLISIFFFFSALFFLLKKSKLVSSFSFAVSLIVYPYFFIIFSTIIFFMLLNQILIEEDKTSKKIIKFLLYFILPTILMCVYINIYISYGFQQTQEGFTSLSIYNPFSGLTAISTFTLFMGISYLYSNIKSNKIVLILVFANIIGFLIYCIPYYFFNIGTTYYLSKVMNYLIFFTIIIEAYFIQIIYKKLKRKLSLKFLN